MPLIEEKTNVQEQAQQPQQPQGIGEKFLGYLGEGAKKMFAPVEKVGEVTQEFGKPLAKGVLNTASFLKKAFDFVSPASRFKEEDNLLDIAEKKLEKLITSEALESTGEHPVAEFAGEAVGLAYGGIKGAGMTKTGIQKAGKITDYLKKISSGKIPSGITSMTPQKAKTILGKTSDKFKQAAILATEITGSSAAAQVVETGDPTEKLTRNIIAETIGIGVFKGIPKTVGAVADKFGLRKPWTSAAYKAKELFTKFIKPESKIKKPSQILEFQRAGEAVMDDMVANQGKLKFHNVYGEEIVGELPKDDLFQMASAVENRKQDIFKAFDEIEKQTDSVFDFSESSQKFSDFINEKQLENISSKTGSIIDDEFEKVATMIKQKGETLNELKPKQIREFMQWLFDKQADYEKKNKSVFKLAVEGYRFLRDELEDSILSYGGSDKYGNIKKLFSDYKKVEKQIDNSAKKIVTKAGGGLTDMFSQFSVGEIAVGIGQGSQPRVAKGLIETGILQFIKKLKDPNIALNKAFAAKAKEFAVKYKDSMQKMQAEQLESFKKYLQYQDVRPSMSSQPPKVQQQFAKEELVPTGQKGTGFEMVDERKLLPPPKDFKMAGTAKVPLTKAKPVEFNKLVMGAQTADRSLSHTSIEKLKKLDINILNDKSGGFALNSVDKKGIIELTNVFVNANMRGKGVGSNVMNNAIQKAKEKGAKKIVLDAYKRLEKFYEKFGFKTTKEVPFDPQFSKGFDPRIKGKEYLHNIVFMEKKL